MPFGLNNLAQAFQRLMNGVLGSLERVFVYLDGILVASSSLLQHIQDLHAVVSRLPAAGLTLNRKKCVLASGSVIYLGHVVDSAGMAPLPSKVEGINAIPPHTTKVALQQFLGCINFFHWFLPGIAALLAPLHSLTASHPRNPLSCGLFLKWRLLTPRSQRCRPQSNWLTRIPPMTFL